MRRILVVYATTDGHTAKVARFLGEAVHTAGSTVHVVEASRSGPCPEDYDGVLVAASVHAGQHQKRVEQWVRANLAALHERPTAFISICLSVLEPFPKGPENAAANISRFLMHTGWKPTVSKSVAGALLYTRYGWLKRWVMKRIVAKTGGPTDTTIDYEYTNWRDLYEFADKFRRLGGPAASHTSHAA